MTNNLVKKQFSTRNDIYKAQLIFYLSKMQKKWKSNLKLTDHHFFIFFYKFQFIPIKLSLLWFLNQHNPTEALQKLRFGCWTHMKPIFTHTWHRKSIFYGEMYPFYPIFWHISPFFSILGWTKHRKTLYFLKGMGVTTLFSLWGHHNLLKQRLHNLFRFMSAFCAS